MNSLQSPVIIVATILLAGCSGAAEPPPPLPPPVPTTPPPPPAPPTFPTPSPSPTPTPTPAPTPTPTPTPTPASTGTGTVPVTGPINPARPARPSEALDFVVQNSVTYALAMQSLSQRQSWLTAGDKGTLSREALDAILGTCEELGNNPRECAPKVAARTAPFDVLSPEAAREGLLLLEQCEEGEALQDCRSAIEDERYIRNLAIGRAQPSTLKMNQGQETNWSVRINRTNARVIPGEKKVVLQNAPSQAGESATPLAGAITFSRSTCFELEYDRAEFSVKNDRDCPQYRRGDIPYIAQWDVTPLKDGTRELTVTAIHKRGDRDLNPETVPTSPFKIEVTPRETVWTAILDRWATLLGALAGLIAAIWGLLKVFKRPKPGGQADPS